MSISSMVMSHVMLLCSTESGADGRRTRMPCVAGAVQGVGKKSRIQLQAYWNSRQGEVRQGRRANAMCV